MTPPRRSRAAHRHADVVDLDPRRPHREGGAPGEGTLLDVVAIPEAGKVMIIVAYVIPEGDAPPLPVERPPESRYVTVRAGDVVLPAMREADSPEDVVPPPREADPLDAVSSPARDAGPLEDAVPPPTDSPEGVVAPPTTDSPEGLRVDRASRRVWVDGREVALTYQEFELLHHFITHPWTVFSRAELMAMLWPSVYAATRTVDVHVHRLRRKLGREGDRLATVRRIGYVYRPQAGP